VVKALLLLPGAFTGFGGIEKYNRLLIRAFAELEKTTGLRSIPLVLNDAPEDVDGRYVPPGAEWPRAYGRNRRRFIGEAIRLTAFLRPELVVFGHLNFARLSRALRAVCRPARHWYVVHGIEAWRDLPPATRKALACADRILSVSRFTKDELLRRNPIDPSRMAFQSNAVDPIWQEQFGPREGRHPPLPSIPTLLTVARLAVSERYKGIDSVLRALPAVARAVPDVRYVIAGGGEDSVRLGALARELGLAERVLFPGPLWPDELARAFRDCTVFVMPSSKEGFGIVYLEAAIFGRPSVAGRHGGAPEAVQDGVTGTLVDREDIPGIEAALVRYLRDPEYAITMGKAASRRTKESFIYDTFRTNLAAHLVNVTTPATASRAE
jgi:phosphatidylinositol alpha-1,6-mannosyltransferase